MGAALDGRRHLPHEVTGLLMHRRYCRGLLTLCMLAAGCGGGAPPTGNAGTAGTGGTGTLSVTGSSGGADQQVKSLGSDEVTARLVEIPEGAIFERDLYHYAAILKYEVVAVHRGAVEKG